MAKSVIRDRQANGGGRFTTYVKSTTLVRDRGRGQGARSHWESSTVPSEASSLELELE